MQSSMHTHGLCQFFTITHLIEHILLRGPSIEDSVEYKLAAVALGRVVQSEDAVLRFHHPIGVISLRRRTYANINFNAGSLSRVLVCHFDLCFSVVRYLLPTAVSLRALGTSYVVYLDGKGNGSFAQSK